MSRRSKSRKKSTERYGKSHTEKSVLYNLYMKYHRDYDFFCRNKYVFHGEGDNLWESDGFMLSKSNLSTEFEVKVSRSDWAKEQKDKKPKHEFLLKTFKEKGENLRNPKYNPDKNKSKEYLYTAPNYFNVVCQEGLIQPEEVQEVFPYAGLKWVMDSGAVRTKLRVKLHPIKIDLSEKLLYKFYYKVDDYDYHSYILRKEYNSLKKAKSETGYKKIVEKYLKGVKVYD